jgi:hypothetical protein
MPPGPTNRLKVTTPSRERQNTRLGHRFEHLAERFRQRQAVLQFEDDPAALAPERAIVFEVASSVTEFYVEAARAGFEYLAEDEVELDPDEDFHPIRNAEQRFAGRVYMAMPDQRALQELLRVWNIYKSAGRMPNGFGIWTHLFGLLKDVRAWGPQDRVLPETLSYWREALATHPDEPVRFEVDLWFRSSITIRRAKAAALATMISDAGGRVWDHSTIPEIRYDALLVDLPAHRVQELLDHPDVFLARSDEVMFLRPQAMARFPIDVELTDHLEVPPRQAGYADLMPLATLLDGLPMQNHQRLANRLNVVDLSGLEETYLLQYREHGTEMASLIVNGDLNANEQPLGRPLCVLPILRPSTATNEEWSPPDRLFVDVIYQAVRSIKEGHGEDAPIAPSAVLFNLSIGDTTRPFAGPMSPCGRLLDFLAYKYRILFLVSAGNVKGSLEVPEFATWSALEEATPEARERAILGGLHQSKAFRTLLSPAEALNVVTVGAAHRDSHRDGVQPHNAIDPWTCGDLPNVSSALGLGHRRVIKPDILMNGGRELVRMRSNNPLLIGPVTSAQQAFGLRTAAPDQGGDLRRTSLTFGTSAATALATRAAHQILETLADASSGSQHTEIPREFQGLVAKALLVHGASWGSKTDVLVDVFGPGNHDQRKDNVARLLGYGAVDVARSLDCTQHRATLLRWDSIGDDEAKLFRIPLPTGLESSLDFRAVTFTIAWFSPINARHQGYRAAALNLTPGGDGKYSLAIDRAPEQPHFQAVKRGSVLHERREGSQATAFVDDGDLLFTVSCRASAGELNEQVPFAVAISIEVGVESEIAVYDEVRTAIENRIRPVV